MEDMARLAVIEQSVRDVDKFNKILYELLQYISHILENPHDNELRTIKSEILKDVLNCDAFKEYLKYVGFKPEGTEVIYPKEQTLNNLRMAQASIERKLCFCYGAVNRQKRVKFSQKKTSLKPTKILTTNNSLLLKIERLFNDVLAYEDEDLQEYAREQIPIVTLQLLALERVRENQKLIKTGELKGLDLPFDIALLMELMSWFKYKFFKWVDQPPCEGCGGQTSFSNILTVTTDKETCRMEVYNCVACPVGAKFVRYNDPRTLLRTRRGRCGEWANCFALICRALGYDTRLIYDTTDHVWCEIFDYDSNTWLHADPCEAKLNAPLLYSHGWGKKLCYVIAVSRDDVQDVTWRYTNDHKAVLSRRKECSEQELLSCILTLREHRQRQVSEPRRRHLAKRTLQELVTLMVEKKPTDYESHGRISGSKQWRSDRGEVGPQSPGHSFSFPRPGLCALHYHAATDCYRVLRDGDELSTLPSWAAGVYDHKNIFRKVEHDWKKVYLAREEGEAVGHVSWRVCAGPGLLLSRLRARVATQLYSTGTLTWTLQYDDLPPVPANFDNDDIQRGVTLDRTCQSLILRVELTGGEGDVAWQHAQLCRQPLDGAPPALQISAIVIPRT
ncbi:unnamed protein product [Spodoptera littoralis]|uniref:Peptide-N(4)-(N-acetyl-beta-glucosaminyl)asparagine amidase n=1 Tax=Spodoptera littoralis TaxID=7109 RepID=A0A9P0I4Q3_SPOLI|nr:unnamed protein product [Spodoptera littoralis]CAH1640124.1 unnamed protein product [Spodoptera littoralis]